MPVYDLKLKAELENVESISATDETIWRIKVECKNCSEVSPSFIEVSSTEEVEVPGTRGTCNCLYTCKSFPFSSFLYCLDAEERFKLMLPKNP